VNKFIKDICSRIYKNCDTDILKNKTILVTGANGLIGGFLADYFDYLNVTYDYNIKIFLTSLSKEPSRLKHLLSKKSVKYYSEELSSGIEIDTKVDYCFYCAGYAQPSKFLSDTTKTFFLNTNGLYKTFDSIYKNNKDAKCIFLSSSEIYTMNETDTSHKETDFINLSLEHKRNSYIFGKIAGEMIVNNFRNLGCNATSTRVSLCYGPGHLYDDARVMSDITRKGMSSDIQNIKLFDDGSAFRRYLHISDFVIMLLNVSLYGKNDVYNIGGKEETTIYNLAKIIGNKFNKDVKKGEVNNDVITSAPKKVWVSLDRYEQEFGVLDFMSLEDGMDNYLNWFINEFAK
jgi:dTDP-glucose 4,6-dehydratase/UDP-glucuronate decarboxylase